MPTTKRERLFNQARRTKTVTLTTGDVVEVRPLTITARTKLAQACKDEDGQVDLVKLVPELLIACTYDPENGEPLFTIGDRETIEALQATDVDPIWTAAAALNGFAEDAVEVAEKN
jgi:hypothetical protein